MKQIEQKIEYLPRWRAELLAKAMLVFASAPMLGVYPLLARQYGQERVGSAALLVATAGAFVTMSLLLAAL